MANTHRRVEPRSIIGTGMATDPDRVRELEQRAARFERDRNLPKRKFGDVIASAPPKPPPGTELMNEAPPERQRKGVSPRPPPRSPPGAGTAARRAQERAEHSQGDPGAVETGGKVDPQTPPMDSGAPSTGTSTPPPNAEAKDDRGATPSPGEDKGDAKGDKKPAPRPPLGAVSPGQSTQMGGATRVTFKV